MWNPDLYHRAWDFAAAAHGAKDQRTPDKDYPYIYHIGMVVFETAGALAQETFTQPNLAIQCALLHDVIEDTAVTHDQISKQFGTDVAAGVLALTKYRQVGNKQAQMADSLRRIQQQPREVWLVKLADRIANLQAPPSHWSNVKRSAYRTEAMTIHEALRPASPYLAARLSQRITSYKQYIQD